MGRQPSGRTGVGKIVAKDRPPACEDVLATSLRASAPAQQLFALRLLVLQHLEDCGGQGWQGRRISQGEPKAN